MKGFLIKIGLVAVSCFAVVKYVESDKEKLLAEANTLPVFFAPKQSPFKNNVGICFSVEQSKWFIDPSIKYNQALQDEYTYGRLLNISKDFKLIRIYSYLIAGWEQTGTPSPEGYALTKLVKQDTSVEALIGTSNNITWFLDSNNVQFFISTLKTQFGSSISQVKGILIGNEINANSYSKDTLATIFSNYNKALKKNNLNIPISVSFNNLPIQSGDFYSDSLVACVVRSWNTSWNNNNPFVFIDPYPDAEGINNAAGVYSWQYNVTKYYQATYPSLQIFIGETGAEGSPSDYQTTVVLNSIFIQLNKQYDSIQKTVPSFIFEGINESLKPSIPNQQYMGVYVDSSKPSDTTVHLKIGIKLPTCIKK